MIRRVGAALLLAGCPALVHAAAMRHADVCELPAARVTRVSFDLETRRVRSWPMPLDRIVSFNAGDVALRTALDRVATEARVRLSYSPDLLSLDRRVCLSFPETPLGDVLMALLGGSGLAPVVIGTEQVVLAPARAAVGADATPDLARGTTHLERVVVTGTATGGVERSSPFALSVIDGRSLSPASMRSMSATFDGAVPGVWMWAQSPVSAVARYGSLRGASSFGVSAPKVYIDGIEVANPLMVTQIDPSSIERIEVIRGPQGAALYGSDAISGVVQIVTRHDGANGDEPASDLRVSAGNSTSSYADGGILAQEHGISVRRGAAARTASLGLSVSTLGAYTPGAKSRQLVGSAGVRHVGERLILTGTARVNASNSDVPASPLLRGLLANVPTTGDTTPQRVRQYTLGASGTLQASEHWTHALTVGVDGYRLSGLSADALPLPSATDSALRAARGGADRASARYSAARRFASPETRGVLLTLGAEHSTAREETNGFGDHLAQRSGGQRSGDSTLVPPADRDVAGDALGAATTWWRNSGVLAQARAAVNPSLFVTGGARLEHISGPATSSQVALLPLLGASWVGEHGPFTLKLRAAYGRGIRPARTVARGATWMGGRGRQTLTALEPEEQSGIEAGADALWGQHFGVSVTRFDQRASGLVQPVALVDSAVSGGGPGPSGSLGARIHYQLQNVGAIDNQGWEIQGRSSYGPLLLGATLSLVSSRVARLATGYRGDLRQGDRMLEVPARTMGLSASWVTSRWSTTGAVARAEDWINYDKIALAAALARDTTGTRIPVGPVLRRFWRVYEGTTRLSLRTSYAVRQRAWLSLSGENLLNRQLGEPDNVTVVPGRTVIVGIRTAF